MDLQPLGDAKIAESGTHHRVLDVADLVHRLYQRPDHAVLVGEEGRHVARRDVAIFVDRSGESRAAMLAEPDGIVGATAEERDAEGGSAHDHAEPRPMARR